MEETRNQVKQTQGNVETGSMSTPVDPSIAGVMQPQAESEVMQEVQLDTMKLGLAGRGRFRKLIFLLPVVIIILGILVFLGLKSRTSNTSLYGTKGEIVWWGIQYEKEVFNPLIEEYQKENPGVRIIYEKQSSIDYRERLTNALVTGVGPDIFEIHNSWVPMYRDELFAIPSSVMSKDEFSSSFYPVAVSDFSLNNEPVALPLEFDAITLFINEDIFAAAAKTPPTSWNEVRVLAGELTQRGEDGVIIQSGVSLGITSNIDHWQEVLGLMMFQNKVKLTSPAKSSPKSVGDVLGFYTLFKSDGVWEANLPPSSVAFAKGNLAMYFGPIGRVPEILKTNPELKFKTVLLPQLPREKPDDPVFSYATYWAQGVWGKSRSREDAWQFLKFMVSRESLEKLNKSIETNKGIEVLYPRPEMNIAFREHSVLGSVVALAPFAKSFYLADETFDGSKGINSQVNKLFEDLLIGPGGFDVRKIEKFSDDLSAVLSKYRVPSE